MTNNTDEFPGYNRFKTRIIGEYPLSGIDQLTYQEGLGYWLNQGMFRWYRICKAINETCRNREFNLLDVGAYPFTALKVAKVMFPAANLFGAGLWDSALEQILQQDPLLTGGTYALCNLDPWIVLPEHLCNLPQELPMADSSVDFVIFTEVIEHLYNPAHALKEISRVLKPGGRVYLTTNNVAYWFQALRLLRGETNLDIDLGQISVDFHNAYPTNWRGHVRFYSISQLTTMLRLAGIDEVVFESSYDTTEILPSQHSLSKQLRTWVKGMTNSLPFMNRLRGHIEIIAAKTSERE